MTIRTMPTCVPAAYRHLVQYHNDVGESCSEDEDGGVKLGEFDGASSDDDGIPSYLDGKLAAALDNVAL